ncbi:hypothetical protein ACP70R_025555 [Stipagrostis hirtigluma subsp. patula]
MVAKEFAREVISMDKVKRDGEALIAAGDEEEDDSVLPGFRFHPTDDELVTFYLRRKIARKPLSIEIIKEIDIYKYDPWDLPKASTVGGDKEWYFFCLRGRKYRNSIRPNRVTGSGFWKATGIDRPIYSAASAANSGEAIGLKKSLVYYRGSAGKGTKTDWMMHEFRLPPAAVAANTSPSMQDAEVWTICRIFKRNITYKRQQQPQQVWRPAAPPADSSSNNGSFDSDVGDEYMNRLPAAGPIMPQQHHFSNQMSMVSSGNSFFRESVHSQQQFHGQWLNALPVPEPEQKPQVNQSAMTIAFHQQNDQSLAGNDCYKDGYWEEIARFMEVNDPAALYDCRYA